MKGSFLTLIALVICYLLLRLMPGHTPVSDIPYFTSSDVSVIAHRGGRGLRPGNTIEAAVNAINLGSDVIELDVHLTADQILVVRHDDNINTTTNGTGLIRFMSAEDIGQYSANFHSVDFPNKKFREDIKVPTLESMFEKLPNKRYLIELKPKDELTADALCTLVTKSQLEDQVIVGSFHSETLKYFREQCPIVPTSIGQSEMVWLVLLERLKLGHLFKTESYSIQVPVSYGGYRILSPSLVDLAHSLNMRVDVWTVNSPEVMKEVISMGVDGVITDYPDRLISILNH